MEKLLTIPETAALLKLHPRAVLRLIHAGKLRASRVGRKFFRVQVAAVQEFLASDK